jgi:hypothetical protein
MYKHFTCNTGHSKTFVSKSNWLTFCELILHFMEWGQVNQGFPLYTLDGTWLKLIHLKFWQSICDHKVVVWNKERVLLWLETEIIYTYHSFIGQCKKEPLFLLYSSRFIAYLFEYTYDYNSVVITKSLSNKTIFT